MQPRKEFDVVVTNEKEVSENPLSTVANYYLDRRHLISKKSEATGQLGPVLASITGAPLYAIPARNYAIDKYGEDAIYMQYLFIIGTCTPALLVLYNATHIFRVERSSMIAPKELSKILKSQHSPFWQKVHDSAIVTGSLLSSFPLATISYLYPIPGMPLGGTLTLAAFALFDNTVLHFLPIQQALQNKFYRFPVLIVEYPVRMGMLCLESSADKSLRIREENKELIYQKIKGKLKNTLMQSYTSIQLNYLKFEKYKLSYRADLPEILRKMIAEPEKTNGLEKLLAITSHRDSSLITKPKGGLFNSFMLGTSYLGGSFLVISSCIGYVGTIVKAMIDNTGKALGTTISVPPVYFLSVLFAYLGGNTLAGVYSYLTSWESDDIKLPLEFKLYLKTTGLILVLDAMIAAFSYASAEQLIEDNLDDEIFDAERPALIWLARVGVAYLSFFAVLSFAQTAMNKIFAQYGGVDSKMVIQLCNMIHAFNRGIDLMDGELLMDSLELLDEAQLKSVSGMEVSELKEVRNALNELDEPNEHSSLSPGGSVQSAANDDREYVKNKREKNSIKAAITSLNGVFSLRKNTSPSHHEAGIEAAPSVHNSYH